MSPLAIVGLILLGLWVFTSTVTILALTLDRSYKGSGAIGMLALGVGWPIVLPWMVIANIRYALTKRSS